MLQVVFEILGSWVLEKRTSPEAKIFHLHGYSNIFLAGFPPFIVSTNFLIQMHRLSWYALLLIGLGHPKFMIYISFV